MFYFIHKIVVSLLEYWLYEFKWKENAVEFQILSALNLAVFGGCVRKYECKILMENGFKVQWVLKP